MLATQRAVRLLLSCRRTSLFIIACVRSMMGGYVFTCISLSVHTWRGGRGYPSPRFFPRFLVPGPFLVVPQSLANVLSGVPPSAHVCGYPMSSSAEGLPQSQLGWYSGPSWVGTRRTGVPPYARIRTGVPSPS